jgi:pyruvate/2-oxoglutarate/acetoin dehydrogenase E1 component
VAAADTPIPFSPPLEERVLPGRDDVLRAARETLDY